MARRFYSSLRARIPIAFVVAIGVGSFVGGQMTAVLTNGPAPSASFQLLTVIAVAFVAVLIARMLHHRDDDVIVAPPTIKQPSLIPMRREAVDFPSSEHLATEINASIERGCGRTLLALIELKDFERLYAFDPEAAKAILVAFASRLRQVLGEKHPASHLSRGSFGVWFSACDSDVACESLGTISYALRSEIKSLGLTVVPDVSLKVGIYPDDGEDADTLLMKTSISGSSPGSGLPQISRQTDSSEPNEARQRYSLEQDLRHAVERHELILEYQPIVDLDCGRVVSAEALIRWRHPSLGLISPAQFVPLLEKMGLINEIGMWSLNAACAALRSWEDQGLDQLTVAVNLSARQLQGDALIVAIERTLAKHELKPHRLTLELTETAAMLDADRTLSLFHSLKDIGVNLAIDDFGTGYSSMSYLLTLPFDKLKIDRAFVTDVHVHVQRQAICRSLLELARGLKIGVVAEGAEAAAEVAMLQQIGCHLIQGFYFSRPIAAEQIPALAGQEFWPGLSTTHPPELRLAGTTA